MCLFRDAVVEVRELRVSLRKEKRICAQILTLVLLGHGLVFQGLCPHSALTPFEMWNDAL